MAEIIQTNQVFTAAQIAAALRIKRQSVHCLQSGIEPCSRKSINGQLAAAWSFAALAPALQQRLHAEAVRIGFRAGAGEELLSRPAVLWKPSLPMGEIAQHCLDKAVKLQRAMAATMTRLSDEGLSAAEFEALGLRDYEAAFGHKISSRHFRRLVKRTIERDGGAENWARVEIYLDSNLASYRDRLPANTAGAEFQELHTLIAAFRHPTNPSRGEQADLWRRAKEVLEDSGSVKKAKRRLIEFLWRYAPSLGRSPNAIRVNLDRKLKQSGSLSDGRCAKRGEPSAPPIDPEDIDHLIAAAIWKYGGRVSQAVREERAKLSPETQALIDSQGSKSRVNGRLREAVRHEVNQLLPYHQGPRAADKVSASLTLSYDGIFADQCWMADDFTMPVRFYVPDGNWFRLVRGQVLIAIDFRTLRVLGYSLQPDEQYNSLVIRTLFTRTFDERGIPEILYLERGIWKTSKLITGGIKAAARAKDPSPLSWSECETGLQQFGIEFIHARRARSKPVERVGGLLQDLMEGLRGYCGREERKDRPEADVQHEREVNSGKAHPSKYYMDQEEWDNQLCAIIEKYNATRQEGRRINGLSPDQAYELLRDLSNPPSRFDASCRWLLAHHKIPVSVTDNGITFSQRGQTFNYRGEQTSRWRGHKMIAWFDPEIPEILTVTDHNQRNAFTVERANSPCALPGRGDEDLYRREVAKAQAHGSHQRTRYRVLKTKFEPKFRGNIVAAQTQALGVEIGRQQSNALNRRTESEGLQRSAERLAKDCELPASFGRDKTPEQVEALKRMAARRKEEAV